MEFYPSLRINEHKLSLDGLELELQFFPPSQLEYNINGGINFKPLKTKWSEARLSLPTGSERLALFASCNCTVMKVGVMLRGFASEVPFALEMSKGWFPSWEKEERDVAIWSRGRKGRRMHLFFC